jgi:AcrR family transcriptional regulator
MVIEETANVAAQTSRSRGRASGPAQVEKPQAKAAKAAAAGPVQAGAPSTDPRVLLSRERVLSTTLELLTESGLGGLTIDDVSKRSGVAKTTIYRHWRTRNALIIDACLRMTDGDEDPPDTGSLEGDLGSILTELADLLATARWSSIMPSIMDAAEREPEIAELHSRLQIWHAAPMRRALERAVERGQISPDVDINVMASALRGPLYFRRWFTREPINAPFIEFVVRGVIAAVDAG